jgi:hypothetical protein
MELTWLMRLRIAAAAAVGVVLLGILAWPLAAPPDPAGAVRSANINFNNAAILLVVAFVAGYIAYFASWPIDTGIFYYYHRYLCGMASHQYRLK